MSTIGFGILPFGGGPFGAFAVFPDLSVVSAVAVSTHAVRVTLTTPPRAVSPSTDGDALNPTTWEVVQIDTGFDFTVLSVLQVGPVQFDVVVYEPFASALIEHRVSAPTLLRADGALVVAPKFADFLGALSEATATAAAVAARRQFSQTDIANPPAPPNGTTLGGTLTMTAAGDYASVSGAELVKKLIIRRLSTLTGEFFHLPNYGLGLRVKEPLPTSDLIKLRAEAERQIMLEPEVEAVSAPIVLSPANGVLSILVRARLRKTGSQIDVPFQFPPSLVQL